MTHFQTTDAVAASDRVPYWVDLICSTYVQLECEPGADGRFTGSIAHQRLPGLELTTIRSSSQRVCRTPRAISASSDRYVLVSVQIRGQGRISQDGRQAILAPGDFAIYDSTRPYTLDFGEDFEERVLKVRADALGTLVRGIEALTAARVSGRAGAGRLLIDMVRSLQSEADVLPAPAAAAVSTGVLNLLAAGLQTLPACRQGVERSALEAYHLARIKGFIDQNLGDSSLSIEKVAARLEMSTGHLHRLFKAEAASPSQYLWSRRLERCGRDLVAPQLARVPVSEIAFRWGFNDAAHFSRAFRERYGCAPREWRRQALAQPAPA